MRESCALLADYATCYYSSNRMKTCGLLSSYYQSMQFYECKQADCLVQWSVLVTCDQKDAGSEPREEDYIRHEKQLVFLLLYSSA